MTHLTIQHPRGVLVEGYRADKHPLYRCFHSMWSRCTNPKELAYKNYGARGIKICQRWRRFVNFIEDMGPRPTPAHSLERKNNNGNYTPSNCVWAVRSAQMFNRRKFESNTSGATGVIKLKRGNWEARFDYESVRYPVGIHDTFELALTARAAFVAGFFAARGGLHGNR